MFIIDFNKKSKVWMINLIIILEKKDANLEKFKALVL